MHRRADHGVNFPTKDTWDYIISELEASNLIDPTWRFSVIQALSSEHKARLLLRHLSELDDLRLPQLWKFLSRFFQGLRPSPDDQESFEVTGSTVRIQTQPHSIMLQYSQKEKRWFSVLSTSLNKWRIPQMVWLQNYLQVNSTSAELRCIGAYLDACHRIFIGDGVDDIEATCEQALALSHRTRSPLLYSLDFLNLLAWSCLRQQDYVRALGFISDAEQSVMAVGMTLGNKAIGWMYVNKANILIQEASNLVGDALQSHCRVEVCLRKALWCFSHDNTSDGRFGYHYCLCRLAIFHLHCGTYGQLMNHPMPRDEEDSIGQLRTSLRSVRPHTSGNRVLRVQYLIASTDLEYRSDRLPVALMRAVQARAIVRRLGLHDEMNMIQNRIDFLNELLDGSTS